MFTDFDDDFSFGIFQRFSFSSSCEPLMRGGRTWFSSIYWNCVRVGVWLNYMNKNLFSHKGAKMLDSASYLHRWKILVFMTVRSITVIPGNDVIYLCSLCSNIVADVFPHASAPCHNLHLHPLLYTINLHPTSTTYLFELIICLYSKARDSFGHKNSIWKSFDLKCFRLEAYRLDLPRYISNLRWEELLQKTIWLPRFPTWLPNAWPLLLELCKEPFKKGFPVEAGWLACWLARWQAGRP